MIRIAIVGVVAVIVACLNIVPSRGSMTFEEHFFHEEFGPSRGWPFSAVAPTNDEGVILVRGSVVQGGTTVYRDLSKDPRYPHLAVNWAFAVFDLVAAGVFISLALFIPRLFRRTRRPDAVHP